MINSGTPIKKDVYRRNLNITRVSEDKLLSSHYKRRKFFWNMLHGQFDMISYIFAFLVLESLHNLHPKISKMLKEGVLSYMSSETNLTNPEPHRVRVTNERRTSKFSSTVAACSCTLLWDTVSVPLAEQIPFYEFYSKSLVPLHYVLKESGSTVEWGVVYADFSCKILFTREVLH